MSLLAVSVSFAGSANADIVHYMGTLDTPIPHGTLVECRESLDGCPETLEGVAYVDYNIEEALANDEDGYSEYELKAIEWIENELQDFRICFFDANGENIRCYGHYNTYETQNPVPDGTTDVRLILERGVDASYMLKFYV